MNHRRMAQADLRLLSLLLERYRELESPIELLPDVERVQVIVSYTHHVREQLAGGEAGEVSDAVR